jgi:hypothetical protein
MALGRGFRVIGFDPRETIADHRIIMEKRL